MYYAKDMFKTWKFGKIDFVIAIQIIKGFDHISGIRFTSKQIINNEHSKYVEIFYFL